MTIPSVHLPNGMTMPAIGLGTWRMGEAATMRRQEVAALRHGLTHGISLIDTAEMYGDGAAEEIVGEAIKGLSTAPMIVSKVYPWNASRTGTIKACERSLRRLGVDTIDVYLLHWRGEHPLADTVAAMESLKQAGKIRAWGVSNFDTDDIRELLHLADGRHCVVNQVYFNLAKRWPEGSLLPLQRTVHMATMAYSPLNQGKLLRHPVVRAIALRHDATPAEVAIAWLMGASDVVTIPKSARLAGIDEIMGAAGLSLTSADLAELDAALPAPPTGARMETT